jgi:hypothetical protein
VATAPSYLALSENQEIFPENNVSADGRKMQGRVMAEDGQLGKLLWFYMCALGLMFSHCGVGDESLAVTLG